MSKRNSAWTQGHISCAFTGHRPHKFPWKDNEADPRCIALKETLAEQIATLAGAGVTEYFTGGRRRGRLLGGRDCSDHA